jgi:hypothetical protein
MPPGVRSAYRTGAINRAPTGVKDDSGDTHFGAVPGDSQGIATALRAPQ